MPARANSPLKTFVLLVLLAGAAWLAYEFVYVRRIFQPDPVPENIEAILEDLHETLLNEFEKNPCILDLRRPHYRRHEAHYRVDLLLDYACREQARDLCRDVCESAKDSVDGSVSVYAYGDGGVLITKWID